MVRDGRGWRNEPTRHSLARRGIRTRMDARGRNPSEIERKCPRCGVWTKGDVTIDDHGMCYDCFQKQRTGRRSSEPDVTKPTSPYDNKELKKEIKNLMYQFIDEPENLGDMDNEDSYSLFVHEIVGGHQGIHQPGIIADFFNLKIPADAQTAGGRSTTDWDEWEWAFEEIDKKADEVASMINREADLPGTVYFGNLEADGSYGLFYIWDEGDHKFWDAAVRRRKMRKPDAFDYWE